jgi:hypothetical protein
MAVDLQMKDAANGRMATEGGSVTGKDEGRKMKAESRADMDVAGSEGGDLLSWMMATDAPVYAVARKKKGAEPQGPQAVGATDDDKACV